MGNLQDHKDEARQAAQDFYEDHGLDGPEIAFTVEPQEDSSLDGEYTGEEIFLYPDEDSMEPGFPGLQGAYWQGKLVHEYAHERFEDATTFPTTPERSEDEPEITNEDVLEHTTIHEPVARVWTEIAFGDRDYGDMVELASALGDIQEAKAFQHYGDDAEAIMRSNQINGIEEAQARIMENSFREKPVESLDDLYSPRSLYYYQGKGRDVASVDVGDLAATIQDDGYDGLLAMDSTELRDRFIEE